MIEINETDPSLTLVLRGRDVHEFKDMVRDILTNGTTVYEYYDLLRKIEEAITS